MITIQSLRVGAQALAQGQINDSEAERTAAIAPFECKLQAADALDTAGFAEEATIMRTSAQQTIDAANAGYAKAAATLVELRDQIDDMDDAAMQAIIDAGGQNAKRIVTSFLDQYMAGLDALVQSLTQKRGIVGNLRYQAANAVDAELEALVNAPG